MLDFPTFLSQKCSSLLPCSRHGIDYCSPKSVTLQAFLRTVFNFGLALAEVFAFFLLLLFPFFVLLSDFLFIFNTHTFSMSSPSVAFHSNGNICHSYKMLQKINNKIDNIVRSIKLDESKQFNKPYPVRCMFFKFYSSRFSLMKIFMKELVSSRNVIE